MNKEKVKLFLSEKPGLMKTSYSDLARRLGVSREDVAQAIKELKVFIGTSKKLTDDNYNKVQELKKIIFPVKGNLEKDEQYELYKEFLLWKDTKKVYSTNKSLPSPYQGNPDNVLIIGDLHSPFILEGYLEFCRTEQERWDCGSVIFIGDIIDSNSWSYHEHDADGMSVKDELYKAKRQLADWYEVFPNATVLYGNHDLLIARKAKTAGLSQQFVRDLGDVLGAPSTWKFTHEYIKDNVKYIHGSVGNAIKRAKDERMSIVQGHYHSEAFVEWTVSERDALFGLQVGCGLDRTAYAFEYSKPFPRKPIISCGIVLEKGTLPILKLMNL